MRTNFLRCLALTLVFLGCTVQKPEPGSAQATVERATNDTGDMAGALLNDGPFDGSDEGDEAFIIKALYAITQEIPSPEDIANYMLMIDMARAPDPATQRERGRRLVVRAMMNRPAYVSRWAEYLQRAFLLDARNERPPFRCYFGTTGAAETANLAAFIAENPPDQLVPGVALENPPSFQDVLKSSVRLDSLSAAYEAFLLAMAPDELDGADITESNRRSHDFARFERVYLGRVQGCLGCHNTRFSITGSTSSWDRHRPIPADVEARVYAHSAGATPPPDLHAPFRSSRTLTGEIGAWGLSRGCGPLDAGSSDVCNPLPSDGPPSREDVCFAEAQGLPRRPPRSRLLAVNNIAARKDITAALRRGRLSLAARPFLATASGPVAPVAAENDGEASARALAWMVASHIVDDLFAELTGHKLTISNYFPRNAHQRDALFELTSDFVRPAASGLSFSLKRLIEAVVLRPDFNRGRFGSSVRALRPMYDPWKQPDPRSSTNDCSTGPTFHGCIRAIMQAASCSMCHVGASADPGPTFSSPTPFEGDPFTYTSREECQAAADACGATEPVSGAARGLDCTTLYSSPGARAAVTINCAADNFARMPRIGSAPPLTLGDRAAFTAWVRRGAPVGENPEATSVPSTNTVGDLLLWKSPTALLRQIARIVGREYTPAPYAFLGDLFPDESLARTVGVFLTPSVGERRGFALADLLEVERALAPDAALMVGDDRGRGIRAMVQREQARGGSLGAAAEALRQAMLGSNVGLDEIEQAAIADVMSLPYNAPIVADGVAPAAGSVSESDAVYALRKLAFVYLRSPQFLLTYSRPTVFNANTLPSTFPEPSREEIPLPPLCQPRDHRFFVEPQVVAAGEGKQDSDSEFFCESGSVWPKLCGTEACVIEAPGLEGVWQSAWDAEKKHAPPSAFAPLEALAVQLASRTSLSPRDGFPPLGHTIVLPKDSTVLVGTNGLLMLTSSGLTTLTNAHALQPGDLLWLSGEGYLLVDTPTGVRQFSPKELHPDRWLFGGVLLTVGGGLPTDTLYPESEPAPYKAKGLRSYPSWGEGGGAYDAWRIAKKK